MRELRFENRIAILPAVRFNFALTLDESVAGVAPNVESRFDDDADQCDIAFD